MTSIRTKNARTAARKEIKEARVKVFAARTNAKDARSSGFFTPEGIEDAVGGWVDEGRRIVKSTFDSAALRVKDARKVAEKKLRESRSVSSAERAQAAAVLAPVLAPVIAAAGSSPEVLIAAYRNRAAGSLADRFVLEDTITACIDAGMGGPAFAEEWNRTRDALAGTVQSPEEIAAIQDLEAVEDLASYIAGARTLLAVEVDRIADGADAQFDVGSEAARYLVATYERKMDAGTLDAEDASTVRAAADVLETPA